MHSHTDIHLRKEDWFVLTKFPEPGAFVSLKLGKGGEASLCLMFTRESMEALDSLIIEARAGRDFLHDPKTESPCGQRSNP